MNNFLKKSLIVFLLAALACPASVLAKEGVAKPEGLQQLTPGQAVVQSFSAILQDVVSQNVGSKEAKTINAGIANYFSAENPSAKSAAYASLTESVKQFISDSSAQTTLLESIAKSQAGETVDYDAVGNALMYGGVNTLIGNADNLSTTEKTLAQGVVKELFGHDGSLQQASAEILQQKLEKKGFPKEKAQAVVENIQAFVADTKNTTAFQTAASIALQETVNKNFNSKQAATINAAIGEYLKEGGTVKGASYAAVEAAVGQYIKDPETKKTLLEAVKNSKDGKKVDYGAVGDALLTAAADQLIDKTGLTDAQKTLVKGALKEIAGDDGALTGAAASLVEQKLIQKGMDKETAAAIAKDLKGFLDSPTNTDSLVNVGHTLLKNELIKQLGKENAEIVMRAIDDYLADGGTLKDGIATGLNGVIAKYIKGEEAQKTLFEAVQKLKDGKAVDIGEVGTAIFKGTADQLIEKYIPEEHRDKAKALVDALDGDFSGMEGLAKDAVINQLIEWGVPKDQSEAFGGALLEAVKNPTGENVDALIGSADTILTSAVEGAIDKQIAKLTEKFPIVGKLIKEIEGLFGIQINGETIVKFLKSLTVEKIKAAFDKIINMSLDDWKKIGERLLKAVVKKAITAIVNFINKKIDEWINELLEKTIKLLSKVEFLEKYMAVISCALKTVADSTATSLKGAVSEGAAATRKLFGLQSESEEDEQKGEKLRKSE